MSSQWTTCVIFQKPANKPKIYRDPKMKLSARCQKHLFAHCYKDIREHSNNQKLLSFCFEQKNKCLFFIKIYDNQGDHLICSEITNISHHENYSFYKNRYIVSYDWEFCESNYDVERTDNKGNNWWRVMLQQKLLWNEIWASWRLYIYFKIPLRI